MSIVLDARLNAAAKLVRDGAYVCDVGTDHAYLPCAMVLNGKIKGGMAMDVNAGPLENANRTIEEYHLSDQIHTRLSDGLDALEASEQEVITDVMICGMGGELIDTLISRAEWLKNADKRLILQPMTQISYLRRKLYEHGFVIEQEIPVVDKNHLYAVMKVRYHGEKQEISELFSHVGKIPESACEQTADYLCIVAGRLKKAAMGMQKSESQKEEALRMSTMAEEVLRLSPEYQAVTVGDVEALMNEWAPFETQCAWDHSGMQTGSREAKVTGVVIALDCTDDVVDYAIKTGANVIITHHPLIFAPLYQALDGSIVSRLVRNQIALICAHTNLDLAQGGVNDCLASILQLSECEPFGEDHLGRIGMLEHSMTADEFAAYVKQKLHTSVTYWAGQREIRKVALVGGAGSDECSAAAVMGADAYLSGEIKHNYFVDFAKTGMTFVAAGHYATERVVLPKIKEKILKRFASVPAAVYELSQMRSL